MSYDPVNYRKRDASEIESGLDHALSILGFIRSAVTQAGRTFPGTKILEIGPGSDFGAQLLTASEGAEIVVADRFLTRWDADYHPEFYRRLRERWAGAKSQLDRVIDAGDHHASNIVFLEEPAEDLRSVPSGSVDLVYSCAVLEHIVDLRKVADEGARVTKIGGHQFHIIDWRYHRNFDRPLEHLIFDDRRFAKAAEAVDFEFGNRIRSLEFCAHFENAGFRILKRTTMEEATPDYLADALSRLRNSGSSYRDWPERDLRRVIGSLFMRRAEGEAETEAIERSQDVLDLVESLKRTSLSLSAAMEEPIPVGTEIVLRPERFQQHDGHLWIYALPELPNGDISGDGYRSELDLIEDGESLGPPHTSHDDIRQAGGGRFSHWNRDLYLSTSDNTSPASNGRRYAVRVPTAWLDRD